MKEYFDSSKLSKDTYNYYIRNTLKGWGRFVHHIKFVLSEYKNLKIKNIFNDTDAVTIICEMDDEIRHIIISYYIYEEIVFHLEHDRYYDNSAIDFFDTILKLKVLEAFYVTKIDNKDS